MKIYISGKISNTYECRERLKKVQKEMFFLKENIKRDNARLKELADFLGREAL